MKTVESRETAVSNPFPSPAEGSGPELLVTAPVKDRSGNVAFIMAGHLKLLGDSMLGDLAHMKIGKLGYVFVATKEGMILHHPNSARIMEVVPADKWDQLFTKAAEGFDGNGETVNSGGVRTLSSLRRLQVNGWVLGVNYPVTEAYAVITTTRDYLLAGFFMGTLLILILTWVVMNHLTRPLVSVTRQVEQMYDGNLKLIDSEEHDNEVGMLAKAFNRLIREVQAQRDKLRQEEKKYRTVADNTHDWEFWLSPDNRFIYSSPSCKRLTGYDPADFKSFPDMLERIIFPEDRQVFREHRHTAEGTQRVASMDFRIICANGDVRWIAHLCHPVHDEDGTYLGIRGTNRDITAQKQAEQKLHELMGQQQVIIDNIPDMAWLKDREGRYIQVNKQFCITSGLDPEQITGRTDEQIWPSELAQKYREDDMEVITNRLRKTFEEYVVDRTGKAYYLETVKSPLVNDRGEPIGTIGVAHDITQRMQDELLLRHASTHDVLTGLYNRTYFDEEMKRIFRSRRYPISIIMADVNDLKHINDTHGHAAGDRLLTLAAKGILDAFRAEDIIARLGGDEFAVLLPETDETAAAEAIERIRSNLASISRNETDFDITVALGMATAFEGDDLAQTLKLSDQRMYQQKAAQKAFTPVAAEQLPTSPIRTETH